MDLIKEHIKNEEWIFDPKEDKKMYFFKIAEKCSKSNRIEDLVSGTLIYNQLIEQSLVETIILSIIYVKARIWPKNVKLNLDFDKATFGKQIDYFEKYSIEEYNREINIKYLKDILKIRNKVIHHLFDISNFKNELEEYFEKANQLFMLLIEYYNAISEHIFYELGNFDFNKLL